MTTPRFEAVGYCAHYSPEGDRAFAYALRLARARNRQLNVFHFMDDPYLRTREPAQPVSREDLARMVMERERTLRVYYDALAGDYLEVGFRLCEDESWRELHRCLAGHEFQVLVLAKPEPDALFCGKPIETFAESFVCPVVLVGPDAEDRFTLNNSAALLADRLDLGDEAWRRIGPDHARSA